MIDFLKIGCCFLLILHLLSKYFCSCFSSFPYPATLTIPSPLFCPLSFPWRCHFWVRGGEEDPPAPQPSAIFGSWKPQPSTVLGGRGLPVLSPECSGNGMARNGTWVLGHYCPFLGCLAGIWSYGASLKLGWQCRNHMCPHHLILLWPKRPISSVGKTLQSRR